MSQPDETFVRSPDFACNFVFISSAKMGDPRRMIFVGAAELVGESTMVGGRSRDNLPRPCVERSARPGAVLPGVTFLSGDHTAQKRDLNHDFLVLEFKFKISFVSPLVKLDRTPCESRRNAPSSAASQPGLLRQRKASVAPHQRVRSRCQCKHSRVNILFLFAEYLICFRRNMKI